MVGSKGGPRYPILVAVVTAAALALRLASLGAKSFDLDEAVSISYARLGWASFRHAVAGDIIMVLYYGPLKVWRHLGESEASLRALSVIPSVATVPAVYALGKRLFSHRVGLIAALLLAVDPFDIRYAREAPGYSLVVLLVVLSCMFFVRALERPSRRDVAGYLTASVLAVYSHVFAGLVLLAQWMSLVIPRSARVPMNALRMSAATLGVLALPLAVLGARTAPTRLSWIPPTGGLIRYFFANGRGASLAPLAVAYIATCLAAVVCVGMMWRSRKASWQMWRYALLVSWLGLPILTALLVSIIKPMFVPRYLIVCLPPLVLLAAVGFSQINHRGLLALGLTLVVALGLRGDYYYYTRATLEDFRGTTRHILTRAQPGDAVLFIAEYVRAPFEYYRSRLPRTAASEGIVILPRDVSDGRKDLPQLYDRVWLFLSHDEYFPTVEQSIVASLVTRYHTMEEQAFNGVRVRLYSARNGK